MGESTISTGVRTINSMVVRHCNVTCHFHDFLDLLCVFEDPCTLIRSSINFSEGGFDKRRVSMFFSCSYTVEIPMLQVLLRYVHHTFRWVKQGHSASNKPQWTFQGAHQFARREAKLRMEEDPCWTKFFESMFIGQNAGCIWFNCCWVLPHFMAAKGMSTVSFHLCSLQGATRSRFEGLNAKPGARLSSVFHWRYFSCDPGDFSLKSSRRQRVGYVIHMNFTRGWFRISIIILIFSRKKERWCNSTIIPWVLLTNMTISIQLALIQI